MLILRRGERILVGRIRDLIGGLVIIIRVVSWHVISRLGKLVGLLRAGVLNVPR